MNLPVICVCTAAAQINVNRVWAAMGRGPGTFERRLTTGSDPTSEVEPTHYLMSDASTSADDAAEWQAMANGDLPHLPDGRVWGEDGVIGAEDARAAISGGNLQVYSASGDVVPIDHANGVLASRGLSWVPFPEI